MIAAAEHESFDIVLTADRNLRYQQNMAGRLIAIVVLGTNRWATVEQHLPLIERALRAAAPGSLSEVTFRPAPPLGPLHDQDR